MKSIRHTTYLVWSLCCGKVIFKSVLHKITVVLILWETSENNSISGALTVV